MKEIFLEELNEIEVSDKTFFTVVTDRVSPYCVVRAGQGKDAPEGDASERAVKTRQEGGYKDPIRRNLLHGADRAAPE
jgi:photosystem II stability/assembly factor-like uncharacterized protein